MSCGKQDRGAGAVRVLAFSDWRSQDLDLPVAVVKECGDIDLVVYAGDDVRRVAIEPSSVEHEGLLSQASLAIGGEDRAYPWNGSRPENADGPGFGAFFALADALPEQTLTGDLVTTSDGRLGGIFEGASLRRLLEAGLPGAWACGWTFTKSDEMADRVIDGEALAYASSSAADVLMPVLILPRGAVLAEPPGDLDATIRQALRLGPPVERNRFADLAARTQHGLVGVIGNDCFPDDAKYLSGEGVHDLHATPVTIDGWAFLGLRGAPGRIGYTLYSETASWRHLRAQEAALSDHRAGVVVVSHAPPRGAVDLASRFGVEHIGSTSLARFVGRRASLVICGHVHRQGGRTAMCGRCVVVNTANHDANDAPGRFAPIDLVPGRTPAVTWLEPDIAGVEGRWASALTRARRGPRARWGVESVEIRDIGCARARIRAGWSYRVGDGEGGRSTSILSPSMQTGTFTKTLPFLATAIPDPVWTTGPLSDVTSRYPGGHARSYTSRIVISGRSGSTTAPRTIPPLIVTRRPRMMLPPHSCDGSNVGNAVTAGIAN